MKMISPAVNEVLDHHSEKSSRAGSSNKRPVVPNRKPGVSKGTAGSITYTASEIKRRIQSYRNGEFPTESSSLPIVLRWIGRILNMRYEGGTRYVTYQTPIGLITLRLGDHNAVGRNFAERDANSTRYVSVFIERGTHAYVQTPVPYTEIRYPLEVFRQKPQAVFDSIINGVDGMLDNGDYSVNPSLGEKKEYSPEK